MTLRNLDISKDLSSRSQRIAKISERLFEGYFRDARAAGWEITAEGPTGLLYRADAAGIADIARIRTDIRARGFDQPRSRGNSAGSTAATRGPADFIFPHSDGYYERANDPTWKKRNSARATPPEAADVGSPTMRLHLGDCLDLMTEIPKHSVDLGLCDLPFGMTDHEWNRPLDLARLWQQLRRVIRPYCPIVLFAIQPFTSEISMSARDLFKYEIIWVRNRPGNFVQARNRPLRFHENIVVFSAGKTGPESRSGERRMPYYPENYLGDGEHTGYPRSVMYCPADESGLGHPMAKPVPLLADLIRLFTRPGECVLDCTMGTGSAGVAAIETGRSFIGIEKHQPFYEIAARRLGMEK